MKKFLIFILSVAVLALGLFLWQKVAPKVPAGPVVASSLEGKVLALTPNSVTVSAGRVEGGKFVMSEQTLPLASSIRFIEGGKAKNVTVAKLSDSLHQQDYAVFSGSVKNSTSFTVETIEIVSRYQRAPQSLPQGAPVIR